MSSMPNPYGQICTMIFFRYDSRANKKWAFSQMIRARAPLSKTEGLQFYKLFGLGGTVLLVVRALRLCVNGRGFDTVVVRC